MAPPPTDLQGLVLVNRLPLKGGVMEKKILFANEYNGVMKCLCIITLVIIIKKPFRKQRKQ